MLALPLRPSPSQSAVSQYGWSFHAVRGSVDPRYHRYRSRVFGAVEVRGIYELGKGSYLARVRRNRFALMGLHPPRKALWSWNQSTTSQRDWGLLTVRGGDDRRKLGFLPRIWPKIQRQGTTSGPGMGPYPPEVKLAQNVRTPANQRSAGMVGISIPCGEVLTRMISVFVPESCRSCRCA